MTEALSLDSGFVQRAQQGDRDAFAALYDTYVDRIFDFCYQMSRSKDDAADLTSEVFLKAIERLGGLKDPAAFKGWLYSIARNAALNLIERRGRTTAMPDNAEPAVMPGAAVLPPDPSAAAEDSELRQLVWDAAGTLNPRDYSIFEMTVRQGLDSAEVAEALGVKPSHAYVLVSRLKDTVEDALGAVVLARAGRRDCSVLDAIVSELEGELSPRMRRAVVGHLKRCDDCKASRAKYASAAALLGGVAAASPSAAVKEAIARRLEQAPWPPRPPAGRSLWRDAARAGVVAVVAVVLVAFVGAAVREGGEISLSLTEAHTAEPTASPSAQPATPTTAPAPTPAPHVTPRAAPAATPAPVASSVSSVTIFPAALWDGTCGARTASATATTSGSIRSVRLASELGGTSTSTSMSGSGSSWRGTIGPFQTSGTARVVVTATDTAGRTASATRSVPIAHCQQPTPAPTPTQPPKPTPTPSRPPQVPG